MDARDAIEEFRLALHNAGLGTSEPIVPDGKLHRFTVDGDRKGSENGWYVLHVDERPAGRFGSWKTGESITWTAKVDRKLSERERKELEAKITRQRAAQEAEQARLHAEAAEKAAAIWARAVPATTDHAYLTRKGIKGLGARVHETSLVIPVRDETGALTTLQFITGPGEKRFLFGGKIQGCYATIAKQAPTDKILICEGYATGASLFAATEIPTVVAFNAGNLEPVARVIRKKFPTALIVICADNDQWTKHPIENPGVTYASRAAKVIGAAVSVPEFDPNGPRLTDFNDLAQLRGMPIVGETVENAIASFLEAREPEEDDVPEFLNDEPPPHLDEIPPPLGVVVDPNFVPSVRTLDWPCRKSRGAPVCNIENVRALIEHQRITARYNVIAKDVDFVIPGDRYLVDTARNDKLLKILSLSATAGLDNQKVIDYAIYLAGQNPYNPVVEWISSKPWDGVSRVQAFFDTIHGAYDSDPTRKAFKETLIKRWMISAVALAFNVEPISASGVLTITGLQGGGKTHWFKKLAPKHLEVTKDGVKLELDNKDSILQAVSYWLVELGEIDATFKKSDISALKAFVTKDSDELRPAYARLANKYQRRTVFFGSVNDEDFLADPTGNRRFWTIKADSLDYDHGLDMQQVWAEFLVMYQAGEPYHLTRPELDMLNESNRDYEVTNPIEELVRALYVWDAPRPMWRRLTATEVVLELGYKNPKYSDVRSAAKALREISGRNYTKSNRNKLYDVPPFKQTRDNTEQPRDWFQS